MKTVGERIRQAREHRKMSGHDLALAVGYKHQSAIGNLENRATGTGGHKITEIARVLRVPLEWLLAGPDSSEVPFVPQQTEQFNGVQINTVAGEPNVAIFPEQYRTLDQWTAEGLKILLRLDAGQREAMIAKMREYVQYLGPPRNGQALPMADRQAGAAQGT